MSSPASAHDRPSALAMVTRFLFGAREGVRIALDSIRANPFRSGLTVLGVGIGVCVVVLMAGLISGIRGSIQEGIEASGPMNFMIMTFDPDDVQLVGDGSAPEWMRRPLFRPEQAERVARVQGVEQVLLSYGLTDPAGEGGATFRLGSAEVRGVQTSGRGDGWIQAEGAELVEGREFVGAEYDDARLVAIVSRRLAEELVGTGPASGTRVQLRAGSGGSTLPVLIVGVYDPPDQPFGEGTGFQAVVPNTTAIRRFKAAPNVGEFTVVPAANANVAEVEDAVIGALRTARGLQPGEANNFSVVRATQLLELFDRFTGVFFIVMIALSSVGLLVGGVGVVGMMLISVTERTREIGVRKALGATRGEILWQFLVESGVLTLLGGATGLLLGGGLAAMVAWLTPVPASIPLWAVLVSLAAAAVTGMLFGLFPALRAARMAPVDALRHE